MDWGCVCRFNYSRWIQRLIYGFKGWLNYFMGRICLVRDRFSETKLSQYLERLSLLTQKSFSKIISGCFAETYISQIKSFMWIVDTNLHTYAFVMFVLRQRFLKILSRLIWNGFQYVEKPTWKIFKWQWDKCCRSTTAYRGMGVELLWSRAQRIVNRLQIVTQQPLASTRKIRVVCAWNFRSIFIKWLAR